MYVVSTETCLKRVDMFCTDYFSRALWLVVKCLLKNPRYCTLVSGCVFGSDCNLQRCQPTWPPQASPRHMHLQMCLSIFSQQVIAHPLRVQCIVLYRLPIFSNSHPPPTLHRRVVPNQSPNHAYIWVKMVLHIIILCDSHADSKTCLCSNSYSVRDFKLCRMWLESCL